MGYIDCYLSEEIRYPEQELHQLTRVVFLRNIQMGEAILTISIN